MRCTIDTAIQAVTSQVIQRDTRETQPYPPSYIDRFMDWVEQLPIPYWLTYLGLFILHGFINHVFGWADGWLPAFTFSAISLAFPEWLWIPLAIMTYLDSSALDALSDFGPLLELTPEAMQRLKYEFTTMPARGVIISGFIWTGIYVIFTYLLYPAYMAKGFGWLSIIHTVVDGWVSFLIGPVLVYHTIRQLRLVHRTVKMVKQFDLFRLDPVYAFSVLTSRTGVALVLQTSLGLIIPIQLAPVVLLLALMIVNAPLALAVFALPLWVVHQRLGAEKRRLLAEHDQRVKSTLARLHRRLDDNELGEIAQLNNALTGLNAEQDMVTKIPTWPWRAGLITGFLSVIVTPMMLFLIQLGVGRWLGR